MSPQLDLPPLPSIAPPSSTFQAPPSFANGNTAGAKPAAPQPSTASGAISALGGLLGITPPVKGKQAASPPKIIYADLGFPIKVSDFDVSDVGLFIKKVSEEKDVKFKRDVAKKIVYLPIEKINDAGIFIKIPGMTNNGLIPFKVTYDVSPDYDKDENTKNNPLSISTK